MIDDTNMRPVAPAVMQGGEAARQALTATATARDPGPSAGTVTFFTKTSEAFIAADAEARHDLLQHLRRCGVSGDDLVDHFIPAVARTLGERWFADEISFADVTIGAARLQEAVHTLGRGGPGGPAMARDARAILIIIPRGEDHTLGSFVLADQLRRRGFGVDVAVDRSPAQIADLVRKRRYHMIGITASGRRTLASARDLVEVIRRTTTRALPVVVGGPVLDKDLDVLRLTAADHAARDAVTALEKCGLLAVGRDAPSGAELTHAGNGVPVAGGDSS
jgi:methanogenic corrinoid protein MtbC1